MSAVRTESAEEMQQMWGGSARLLFRTFSHEIGQRMMHQLLQSRQTAIIHLGLT